MFVLKSSADSHNLSIGRMPHAYSSSVVQFVVRQLPWTSTTHWRVKFSSRWNRSLRQVKRVAVLDLWHLHRRFLFYPSFVLCIRTMSSFLNSTKCFSKCVKDHFWMRFLTKLDNFRWLVFDLGGSVELFLKAIILFLFCKFCSKLLHVLILRHVAAVVLNDRW